MGLFGPSRAERELHAKLARVLDRVERGMDLGEKLGLALLMNKMQQGQSEAAGMQQIGGILQSLFTSSGEAPQARAGERDGESY